jgi:hypothetical protein
MFHVVLGFGEWYASNFRNVLFYSLLKCLLVTKILFHRGRRVCRGLSTSSRSFTNVEQSVSARFFLRVIAMMQWIPTDYMSSSRC